MTPTQPSESDLELVNRVTAFVCRRRFLRGADADDFGQDVHLHLLQAWAGILAKFEGRSSLKTYLAVVVNRLYLDFQVARFGKWHASAQARRLGAVAVRLERLVYRDGLTFEEAGSVLRVDHGVKESREALHALLLKLPVRVSRTRLHDGNGEAWRPPEGPSAIERAERQVLAEKTFVVLRQSLERMPPEDRLILRMLIESQFSVANAARQLGHEQRALYRRRDALCEALRADLAKQGIRLPEIQELLENLDWNAALAVADPVSPAPSEDPPAPPPAAGRRSPGKGV